MIKILKMTLEDMAGYLVVEDDYYNVTTSSLEKLSFDTEHKGFQASMAVCPPGVELETIIESKNREELKKSHPEYFL